MAFLGTKQYVAFSVSAVIVKTYFAVQIEVRQKVLALSAGVLVNCASSAAKEQVSTSCSVISDVSAVVAVWYTKQLSCVCL